MVADFQPDDAEPPDRADHTSYPDAAKRGLFDPSAHGAKWMKPLVFDNAPVESRSHHANKLVSSPGDMVMCFVIAICLLVGAWLFSSLVTFVFLILSVGLLCAIVFRR